MCGIAAIFAYKNSGRVDRDELRRIRDYMTPRGPDGYGEWYSADKRVGLGHRRLAIIDLSQAGAQPMQTEDGRYVISFNGEIYNFHTLRSGLQSRGYRFRSESDTEVLLHMYAEKGREMLTDLRGMFAFAIWDNLKRELFLARDPFGIKPLYYSDDGRDFKAASQVKALLAGGKVDTTHEPAGHVGFFLWGYVPEPYTMYEGIRALPAGTSMTIAEDGNRILLSYCDIKSFFSSAEEGAQKVEVADMRQMLRDTLIDSVKHHLIADVPVGIFLSSGLDSSTILALATEIVPNKQINTVTLGFNEYKGTINDETVLAEQVAQHYGTRHRTIWVSKKDFISDLSKLIASMDQPTIDGVNTYLVSKAAVEAGLKVALSGLGGDEIFGSYPSFREIPLIVGILSFFRGLPNLGSSLRRLTSPILRMFTSSKYAGLFEYGTTYGGAYLLRRGMFMPWELPKLLDGEMVREGWQELETLLRLEQTIRGINVAYLKVSALEMSWYMRNQLLRDTDWASMAHSLEVRVPLVDTALLRKLVPFLKMSTPPGKRDLASTPMEPLPDEILSRGKAGFTVPVRQWLMGNDGATGERGLRGWAKFVYRRWVNDDEGLAVAAKENKIHPLPKATNKSIKVLALVTDAFGGYGGISKFNRDFLTALCSYPGCRQVIAIPRLMPFPMEALPDRLLYITNGINNKRRFILGTITRALKYRDIDLIICGHINLLPLAIFVRFLLRRPLVLVIHGTDAWKKCGSPLIDRLINRVDKVISVSELTKGRFLEWSGLEGSRVMVLPNAVHLERYGVAEKNPELLARYGLWDKKVIMTMGRLVSTERWKGFDAIIELLPEMLKDIPNLVFLIVGDGNDRKRLESKVLSLGIAERVVFTGFVEEEEKADHFRLADAYVMPSCREGFGIVYLEAMACGIPVVGSKMDGSREALRNGELGILVDPDSPKEVKKAIYDALRRPKEIPQGLDYFSFPSFEKRLHLIINAIHPSTRQPS